MKFSLSQEKDKSERKKEGREDRDSEKEEDTRNSTRYRHRASDDYVRITHSHKRDQFFFFLSFPFTRLAYFLNSFIYFIAL